MCTLARTVNRKYKEGIVTISCLQHGRKNVNRSLQCLNTPVHGVQYVHFCSPVLTRAEANTNDPDLGSVRSNNGQGHCVTGMNKQDVRLEQTEIRIEFS